MGMAQDTHFDRYGTTLALSAVVSVAPGDGTLIVAPGVGFKIRVLAWALSSPGIAVVRFESGTGGTAKTGIMALVAGGNNVAPFCPVGWFDCAENALLNLEVATTAVYGVVVYAIVKIGA